jgi:hypothetical protein
MKVIIAGSRKVTSPVAIEKCIKAVLELVDVTEFVSGAAPGVDSIGAQVVADLGFGVRFFPAVWQTPSGRLDLNAGFKRNVQMAEYADALIAIWDRKSKGTLHMINEMKKRDKRIFLFTPTGKPSWTAKQ